LPEPLIAIHTALALARTSQRRKAVSRPLGRPLAAVRGCSVRPPAPRRASASLRAAPEALDVLSKSDTSGL
jgi:hypothetical protein